jgi:hypothetical protein
MAAESRHLPEQERSIKAREHELYVKPLPDAEVQRKPFPVYLRETPAEPISAGIKTILWIVGALVVIVFAAAIWRTIHRGSKPRKQAAPVAKRPVALADCHIRRLAIDQPVGYLV